MEEIHVRLEEQHSVEFKRRFKILLFVILLAFSLILGKLIFLQIIKGEEFRLKSEQNSIRLRKIRPPRGLIKDAKGRILVENQPSFDILFAPSKMKDAVTTLERLKGIFEKNHVEFTFDVKSGEKARPFAPIRIERNADWRKVALVESHNLELPGVFVEVTPIRKYLEGEIFAHIVGYTGEVSDAELAKDVSKLLEPNDIVGKSGLEKYLDQILRGKNGAEQIEVNVFGRKVRTLGMLPPRPGYNVVLTVDAIIQKTAWESLEGRAGAVVAIDPRNGSVLALVSSPAFDPNLFIQGLNPEDWEKLSTHPLYPMENRAISGQYPPGSTYKLIVAAAALAEGLITPETSFYCDGTFTLGNRTYRCWQEKGHGRVNLHRAIVQSCDVYFYNVGKMLGVDKIATYARAFGFGEPTGIELPGEKGGLIPTKEWKQRRFGEPWQMGETISISIGQGFNLVTPLQLATAYAALANGGTLFRPQIIKEIETTDGRVVKTFYPEVVRKIPLSAKHIEILNYGLWGAVNEPGGTGYAARRKEADVCGKTGTAQVVGLPPAEAKKRRPMQRRFRDHAWFVAFAPYRNPEIVVAVFVEHAGHGGAAAAPVAKKVIDAFFLEKNKKVSGATKDEN